MQLRSRYSGSRIKGLFVIALISLSAIVVLYISYRMIVGNPGVKDAEHLTVKKKEDLIYFLKDKLFYFQVTLDGVIIDTIYLKTYSELLNKQGKISWIYDVNDFKPEEFSAGVVENDSVIWLHPPREYLYEIFQVVSFPNVLKPYEVGNKWSWKLSVSDKWICKDWNVYWKGFLNCNFNYEITGLGIVNVMGENLKYFIVKAESISAVGNTEALMYFHPQMGFVKLHYLKLYGHEMSITLPNVLEYSPNNSNWYEKGVI